MEGGGSFAISWLALCFQPYGEGRKDDVLIIETE